MENFEKELIALERERLKLISSIIKRFFYIPRSCDALNAAVCAFLSIAR